jgi:hypothetical protein
LKDILESTARIQARMAKIREMRSDGGQRSGVGQRFDVELLRESVGQVVKALDECRNGIWQLRDLARSGQITEVLKAHEELEFALTEITSCVRQLGS